MNPLITTGAAAHATPTALSVNLNKVAWLRNARALDRPSVTHAATVALEAGAHGITVHPRPDQRHIRTQDVHDLARLMKAWPQAEFNVEGNPHHNLMELARELVGRGLPLHQLTFVPDSVEQATSDHGWQLPQDGERLAPLIEAAHALGARVSLFMDPLPDVMAAAAALGADRVELYTEAYARAHGTPQQAEVLARYSAAGEAARRAGLALNAGHDLNRDNLTDFLRAVPGVREVSIGHALIADALELGLAKTVRDYVRCIHRADMPEAPRR
ncbi:pyridoxine 5'-phosphate synthase [Methylibium sp.]|uniref:pyridoxine 5'-phosphate synthase n=1 Tax=Methylibium sp. TaxID=2067992 RepID=UPI00286A69AE|nr:pyridoxine 5'-phosphate synthase [Methylibium sp.]